MRDVKVRDADAGEDLHHGNGVRARPPCPKSGGGVMKGRGGAIHHAARGRIECPVLSEWSELPMSPYRILAGEKRRETPEQIRGFYRSVEWKRARFDLTFSGASPTARIAAGPPETAPG